MSWWSSVREVLSRPLAGRPAAPTRRGSRRGRRRAEPAWPHLPSVQRVLAEPITPTAPLDAFAGSLTAHQNPSFLAPLGHAVSAREAGGLVDGLADLSPGAPHRYRAAGELAVPRSARKPVVQRQRGELGILRRQVAPTRSRWSPGPSPPRSAPPSSPVPARRMRQCAPSTIRSRTRTPVDPRALSLSKGQSASPRSAVGHSPEPVDHSSCPGLVEGPIRVACRSAVGQLAGAGRSTSSCPERVEGPIRVACVQRSLEPVDPTAARIHRSRPGLVEGPICVACRSATRRLAGVGRSIRSRPELVERPIRVARVETAGRLPEIEVVRRLALSLSDARRWFRLLPIRAHRRTASAEPIPRWPAVRKRRSARLNGVAAGVVGCPSAADDPVQRTRSPLVPPPTSRVLAGRA